VIRVLQLDDHRHLPPDEVGVFQKSGVRGRSQSRKYHLHALQPGHVKADSHVDALLGEVHLDVVAVEGSGTALDQVLSGPVAQAPAPEGQFTPTQGDVFGVQS